MQQPSSPTTRVSEEPYKEEEGDIEEGDYEDDEDEEEISKETLETSIAARVSIEQFYKNLFRSLKERDER